jgi:hypothetical protein
MMSAMALDEPVRPEDREACVDGQFSDGFRGWRNPARVQEMFEFLGGDWNVFRGICLGCALTSRFHPKDEPAGSYLEDTGFEKWGAYERRREETSVRKAEFHAKRYLREMSGVEDGEIVRINALLAAALRDHEEEMGKKTKKSRAALSERRKVGCQKAQRAANRSQHRRVESVVA